MIDLYWSRYPGEFVNKATGERVMAQLRARGVQGPVFTGTVREWYETLIETTIDMRNQLVEYAKPMIDKQPTYVRVTAHPDIKIIYECSVLAHLSKVEGELEFGHDHKFTVCEDKDQPRDQVKVEAFYLDNGCLFDGVIHIMDLDNTIAPEPQQ